MAASAVCGTGVRRGRASSSSTGRRHFRPGRARCVPQLRPHLPGVDAVEVGGQLADGHAEHFPLAAILGNRHDVRDGPALSICTELCSLGLPSKAHIFHDGTHGGEWLAVVVDAKNGVAVEGDGEKLAHDGLLVLVCGIGMSMPGLNYRLGRLLLFP